MTVNGCARKVDSLFGPTYCGRPGLIYDRARKGWLCAAHSHERLCEFCHADRMWGRICYQCDGVAREILLCCACAGLTFRNYRH
ncbi:MAG: hypothetical protein LZF60_120002 [Nitrospira sp.]|nr:MAG: hypothetical protein LZF60_120002 [Nitrospira sp.]